MINIRNFSLTDGESGILLIFPPVPASLPNKDIYIIDFKVASVLPTLSPPTVTFIPNNPIYSIVKNKNFSPTVNVKIKASHNFETQSLIQAIVRDQYNTIIYNDYLLVICSPVSEFSFKGRFVSNTSADGIGPNGGSVLRMDDANASNSLTLGMSVKGPGIPEDKNLVIRSFIIGRSSDIELSEPASFIPNQISSIYKFSRTLTCANSEQLNNKSVQTTYIRLNKDNNWSQLYDEQTVIKFVRNNTLDDSIEIYLPIKNLSVLISKDSSAPIPSVSEVYGLGRVINSSQCLVNIS
jgi:hypothetical protein